MQLDDLLRLARTRWYVIASITGVFVLLTWALVPGQLPGAGRTSFRATSTLQTNSDPSAPVTKAASNQLTTYAAVATKGDVPIAVAEQIGVGVNEVLARVEVTPSAAANTLTVVATDVTSDGAKRLAELLASELVRALEQQVTVQRQAARASITAQINELAAEVGRLAARPAADLGAKAELQATDRRLGVQRARLADLDVALPAAPLRVLGSASVTQLSTASVADKLLAFPVRTLLALLVGLASSLGVLVLADRFDVRLHTKEAVEAAFGLPVLAEVPVLPRRLRRTVVVADAPESAFSEAHRILRTSVQVARLALGGSDGAPQASPKLIVVTSADPSEGKTTTAVNLAASFAEAGQSTLLVGCDLRHSDLPEVVTGPPTAQVVEVTPAGSSGGPPVRLRVAATVLEHLRCATVLAPIGRPPVVLPMLAQWLEAQRDRFDVMIVDTPPLLVCNDASELIPVADAVVVVCRVGGTTADGAARSAEVLTRLRARVIGVVMVGATLRAPVRKVYGYGPGGSEGQRTPAQGEQTASVGPPASPGGAGGAESNGATGPTDADSAGAARSLSRIWRRSAVERASEEGSGP